MTRTVGKRRHDLRDGMALYLVGAWLCVAIFIFTYYAVSGLAYALGAVR